MKFLFALLLAVLFATQSYAFSTVGFRAYTSASTVLTTCAYVQGTRDADGIFKVSDFGALPLGTKGTASLSLTSGHDYTFNCFKGSDGTAVPAKMFFGVESTTYFPISTFLLRQR